MRIQIISCVFPPEPVVSAKTSAEIAGFMVSKGDDVTVIASFPNRPSGKLHTGYQRKLWSRDSRSKGYKTIRCFATLSQRSTLLNRFTENISFGISSGLASMFSPKADVMYTNTWPIFATGIIFWVARLRRIPLVISVQDVYPESLIAQKRISPRSYFARFLHSIDRYIARNCRSVIVISDNFASTYHKAGISNNQIHVVPNWGDPNTVITNTDTAKTLRNELKIPEESFLCVYAGNIGMASGVDTCIDAFQYFTPEEDHYLLIAGEGSQLAASKNLAARISTNRIRFLSPWPADKTSAVLSAADCFLLPTRGKQSLASVPSKMISYLFAGKPIISGCLSQSETADTIKKAKCGIILNPADPEGLSTAIVHMRSLPESERDRMGQSGKSFALNNFASNTCLPRIESVLRDAQ